MKASKKKTPRSKRSTSKGATRRRLGGLNVVRLFAFLEHHYDDNGTTLDASWYRRLYAQSRAAFLKDEDPAALPFADMLEHIDAATGVETATRKAGFVVGFECCRQLILGELGFEMQKDGGVR
jgi:hypothetical protein